uniref:Uncharacterized protein n=1 Tax=Solanum tuberosum TaxID=4113 RepID=M1DMV0_SOLTU
MVLRSEPWLGDQPRTPTYGLWVSPRAACRHGFWLEQGCIAGVINFEGESNLGTTGYLQKQTENRKRVKGKGLAVRVASGGDLVMVWRVEIWLRRRGEAATCWVWFPVSSEFTINGETRARRKEAAMVLGLFLVWIVEENEKMVKDLGSGGFPVGFNFLGLVFGGSGGCSVVVRGCFCVERGYGEQR